MGKGSPGGRERRITVRARGRTPSGHQHGLDVKELQFPDMQECGQKYHAGERKNLCVGKEGRKEPGATSAK